MRAKLSAGHRQPQRANVFHKMLDQRSSNLRRAGVDETGSPSPARIGKERKLRNNQHTPAHIQHRKVEFTIGIRKDAQMRYFLSQQLSLRRPIPLPYPKQYQQT